MGTMPDVRIKLKNKIITITVCCNFIDNFQIKIIRSGKKI